MREPISRQNRERSAAIYDGFLIIDTSFHGLTPVALCLNPLRGQRTTSIVLAQKLIESLNE
jgi:hypothetical protein